MPPTLPDPWQVLASEKCPGLSWLSRFSPGERFPQREFFDSRIVYYPGSAHDGHPLKIFGKAHAAQCFVFADYGLPSTSFSEALRDSAHQEYPRGYLPHHVVDLKENDLLPNGWKQHVHPSMAPTELAQRHPPGGGFGVFAVLQRAPSMGDSHGPERIAILVIGGDGIATFDALFCQQDSKAPYAVVIQDHGFSGNWAPFGTKNSPLWYLARDHAMPKWLLADEAQDVWPGFEAVSSPDKGGMRGNLRRLFRRPQSPL